MARPPNYQQERLDRDRKKAAKRDAKVQAQRDAVAARRTGETTPPKDEPESK